jgi:hypothetical protein
VYISTISYTLMGLFERLIFEHIMVGLSGGFKPSSRFAG